MPFCSHESFDDDDNDDVRSDQNVNKTYNRRKLFVAIAKQFDVVC